MRITMDIKKFFPYLCICALFLADIFCAAFFEESFFHGVALLYFIRLFTKPSFLFSSCALAFISLESFLYHGRFGTGLLMLFPITLLCLGLKKSFNLPKLGPLLGLGCYLVLYWGLLEPLFLDISSQWLYTIGKIGGNILLMTIFY
jgi:hypothetical protein